MKRNASTRKPSPELWFDWLELPCRGGESANAMQTAVSAVASRESIEHAGPERLTDRA